MNIPLIICLSLSLTKTHTYAHTELDYIKESQEAADNKKALILNQMDYTLFGF